MTGFFGSSDACGGDLSRVLRELVLFVKHIKATQRDLRFQRVFAHHHDMALLASATGKRISLRVSLVIRGPAKVVVFLLFFSPYKKGPKTVPSK